LYHKLYTGIAAELPGWEVYERPNPNQIDRHDTLRLRNGIGQEINLTIQTREKRLNISGNWPQYGTEPGAKWSYPSEVREESPSINVGLGKTYAQMARDIERRFIPEYARVWDLLKARINKTLAYEARQRENWALICKHGVEPYSRGNGDHTATIRFRENRGYGHAVMESADTVKLELRSMPMDLAESILELLTRDWRKEK